MNPFPEESMGCEHPRFHSTVRRVVRSRRASWCRALTQKEAEWTLIADFIARDGLLFLAASSDQDPHEFNERVFRRLNNHARHLFQADYNEHRHRTARGVVLDLTGLELSQYVDRRSISIDPSEAAEQNEINVSVRKAMISTLCPIEMEVIESRLMQGSSIDDTASLLNLTKSQVRRIQTTAVMKLRIALASYRFTETERSSVTSRNSPNGVAYGTDSCAIT